MSRQCLASSGNGIIGNSVLVNQTIGQPYGTSPYYSNGIRYTPGFQQPVFQLQTINSSIHTKVFPNPTASQVTIETDEIVENVRIQVMDVTGKYLLNETVSVFQKHTINCNAWTNGTYLIVLSNGKSSLYSSKLIISK
ncbi:MAG: T9SS type A sorting domain-containing protein [Bacteroidota bacterium]